ncbi:hypothetical protein AU385_12835 [Bacillus halotolerans]|nr:hypothetical protein AU385_12835 [Bacillus halotolerans]
MVSYSYSSFFTTTSDETFVAKAGTADISMPNVKAELNKIFRGFNYINSIYILFIYYAISGVYLEVNEGS